MKKIFLLIIVGVLGCLSTAFADITLSEDDVMTEMHRTCTPRTLIWINEELVDAGPEYHIKVYPASEILARDYDGKYWISVEKKGAPSFRKLSLILDPGVSCEVVEW